jgi:hypothetical protein
LVTEDTPGILEIEALFEPRHGTLSTENTPGRLFVDGQGPDQRRDPDHEVGGCRSVTFVGFAMALPAMPFPKRLSTLFITGPLRRHFSERAHRVSGGQQQEGT